MPRQWRYVLSIPAQPRHPSHFPVHVPRPPRPPLSKEQRTLARNYQNQQPLPDQRRLRALDLVSLEYLSILIGRQSLLRETRQVAHFLMRTWYRASAILYWVWRSCPSIIGLQEKISQVALGTLE